MKLIETFKSAIQHSENLVLLYDSLVTNNTRSIRSEWETRFRTLVSWPKKQKLWRSQNDKILMVGKTSTGLSHKNFTADSLSIFLRTALVMAMAAVDKVLHEAISKKFSLLVKDKKLDEVVTINLSEAYNVALETRGRSGKGGKVRKRPANKIKDKVMAKIYRKSFLSCEQLQKICVAFGQKDVFSQYAKKNPSNKSEDFKKRWIHLYKRRNQIAHECDITRKNRSRKIETHRINATDIKKDVTFISNFGLFLAEALDP